MKKNLLYSFLIGACLTTITSCGVNDWNDKLDGFEGDPAITNVQSISYTLTDADYASLASNDDAVSLAQSAGIADILSNIGTLHYFYGEVTPDVYLPYFLSSEDFAYFTLSDGSSIDLTYNVVETLPDETYLFNNAKEYTVTTENYISVWGSETDYVEAFTPSKPASSNIPSILSEQLPDAASGDLAIVNYNESSSDPDFDIPTEEFVLSEELGSVDVGDEVTANCIITAICARGFIVSDKSGSVLYYYGSGFDATAYNIGDQVTISGAISSYGTGYQFSNSATITVYSNQDYTYPEPTVYTGAQLDEVVARTGNSTAIYAQFIGTSSISGNYYNFTVDGASTAQGSLYQATDDQKALFTAGEQYVVTGYLVSVSSSKYANFIVTSATPVAANSAAKAASLKAASLKAASLKAASIQSTETTAIYQYNGSTWVAYTGIDILQESDYDNMGQSYSNLSDPDFYLPIYLKVKYPYAQAEDSKFVAYKFYNSGSTSYVCDQYIFDGTTWNKNNGITTETAHYVKTGGKWMFDPNVSITLPYERNNATSVAYYQACVDWVYENIDKPLGSTSITGGQFYVSSYGNNEYYSGASAYYCNVDIRPAKAIEQYPAGYANMTEAEVLTLMKDRFCKEVLPGALKTLHPLANTVEGLDVIYSVTFTAYTGSSEEHTVRYKVTGPATFEFIDCTWYDTAE